VTPLRIDTADDMTALGGRLAKLFPERCVVYVEGSLGAGKTTLVRGVLRGLNYRGRVPSPSFSLVEPYELGGEPGRKLPQEQEAEGFNGRNLVHVDLYRLGEAGELEFLGLEDLLGPRTLLMVEWPERGGERLPAADLHIRITPVEPGAGDARDVVLEPETPVGQALASAMGCD